MSHAVPMLCIAGSLAEEVDDKILHAAFIPFGEITDIQIPLDYETGKTNSIRLSCWIKIRMS